MSENKPGKKITLAEARKLLKRRGVSILWRPNPKLPEGEQYCLLRS